jgi:virulence factor
MPGSVRVGVIGVGVMGQRHCRVYSGLLGARLVGVHDLDRTKLEPVGRQYDVPSFAELEALLDQVDAVSLATPTPTHFDLALQCLDRGVHVLVEKPIAESVDQAQDLVEAAGRRGLVLQVGHIERFNPTFTELKNVLAGMTVLAVDFRRLSAYDRSNTDVDVVLDLMTHDIDLVLDLVGDNYTALEARGLRVHGGGVDHAVAHLAFGERPLVSLSASRVTEHKVRSIDVTALEAFVECDLLNKSISVHRQTTAEYVNQNHRGIKYRQESVVERIYVPMFEPLMLELQHFVECVAEGRRPLVSAHDGYRALRLAMEIRGRIIEAQTHVSAAAPGLQPQGLGTERQP